VYFFSVFVICTLSSCITITCYVYGLIFQMLAREIIEDSILSYLTSEVLADNIDDDELSQKVLLAKEFLT